MNNSSAYPAFKRPTGGQVPRKCLHRIDFDLTQIHLPGMHHETDEGLQEQVRSFEVYWICNGGGLAQIDSECCQLTANSLLCLVPGQLRRMVLADGTSGYRLRFSLDFLFEGAAHSRTLSWLQDYQAQRIVHLIEPNRETLNAMEELIRGMQRESENSLLMRHELLSSLLNIFLIHLSRWTNKQPLSFSKDAELVRKFKTLLTEKVLARKQVADYASDLCVTPNYLNRTIKKLTGQTASYHIQQQIILEAKRKALYSNISMKEIAYYLGFDNMAHFSKFFKNNSGMNFTSFRKSMEAA